MTVSGFLTELADKLERGPSDVTEYKTWALLCRDYACMSLIQEVPVPAKVVILWKGARPPRERKAVVATIPLDAAL